MKVSPRRIQFASAKAAAVVGVTPDMKQGSNEKRIGKKLLVRLWKSGSGGQGFKINVFDNGSGKKMVRFKDMARL